MLILDTTTALVKLITSSGADIDVQASGVDHTTSNDTFVAWAQNTLVTIATTTTVVSSPASGKIRNAKFLSFRNIDASVANTLTVSLTNGTTEVTLCKVTLAAGELLVMNDAGVWFVYDVNGGVKVGASAASDTLAGVIQIAVQSDQETATSNILAVTPGRAHFHPSASKAWVSCGVAADIQQSYNITSLTDTGTGIVTITIANDFAAATYCVVAQVEATGTTWAVADSRETHVRNASRAAGSVALDCIDNTTTTNLVKDPTTWHCVMFGDLP